MHLKTYLASSQAPQPLDQKASSIQSFKLSLPTYFQFLRLLSPFFCFRFNSFRFFQPPKITGCRVKNALNANDTLHTEYAKCASFAKHQTLGMLRYLN